MTNKKRTYQVSVTESGFGLKDSEAYIYNGNLDCPTLIKVLKSDLINWKSISIKRFNKFLKKRRSFYLPTY